MGLSMAHSTGHLLGTAEKPWMNLHAKLVEECQIGTVEHEIHHPDFAPHDRRPPDERLRP